MPMALDNSGTIYTLIDMTHTAIINLWPSLSDFADDLSVAYGTAKAMRRRGSIPPQYWPVVIRKAEEREIEGVTLEALVSAVAGEVAA